MNQTQNVLRVIWALSILHLKGAVYASPEEIYPLVLGHFCMTEEEFDEAISSFQLCIGLFYTQLDQDGNTRYRLIAKNHHNISP